MFSLSLKHGRNKYYCNLIDWEYAINQSWNCTQCNKCFLCSGCFREGLKQRNGRSTRKIMVMPCIVDVNWKYAWQTQRRQILETAEDTSSQRFMWSRRLYCILVHLLQERGKMVKEREVSETFRYKSNLFRYKHEVDRFDTARQNSDFSALTGCWIHF